MTPTDFQANFDQWFGQSKVVDAQGKPLRLFHGTRSNNIEAFQPGIDGAGWFAEKAETAEWFSSLGPDSTLYPVYLSLQNPLDTRTNAGREIFHRLVDLDSEPTVAQQLALHGYDGMISEEAPGHPTYLAFHPEQIKSSIGNSGAFSRFNPDIADFEITLKKELHFLSSEKDDELKKERIFDADALVMSAEKAFSFLEQVNLKKGFPRV